MKSSIAIIVPIYNTGKYLNRFFESLKNQTFNDFTIYIVYDESEDNSLEIIKKFEKVFINRFKIIFNKNRDGLGHARDVALDSGLIEEEFIIFLDPDDYLENDFLYKLYSPFTSNDIDMTICGFNRVDEETGKIISNDMVNNKQGLNTITNLNEIIFYNSAVWNKMYRYSVIKELRFSNLKRSEDVLYFINCLKKCKNLYVINEPLYHYMIHDGSLSSNFNYNHLEQIINYANEVYEYDPNNFSFAIFFIKFILGSLYRVYISNKKDFNSSYVLIKHYLKSNKIHLSKYKYLKFKNCVKFGIKGFGLWIYKVMFQLKLSKLFFFNYVMLCKITKKEVRW